MIAPFMPYGMRPPQNYDSYVAPEGMMSIPEMAGTASATLKGIMRVEPMVAGLAGMFVPGLTLVQPWIVMLAPYLEQSLDALSQGNGGDVALALSQMIQHVSKNGVNSPFLTPGADGTYRPPMDHRSNTYAPTAGPSQDASAQGSG
jgi:hypothetical protein